MRCNNILIYEFHDASNMNSNQEIADNAEALRLKHQAAGRRVFVRRADVTRIATNFGRTREFAELQIELQNTSGVLGAYLLTHGGASSMTPPAAELARFVYHVIVRSGAQLRKINIGGCKAAGADYGSFRDSSLRAFGTELLSCAQVDGQRLPDSLMASAYNLWLTTYYAQSPFIVARDMQPDAQLTATLPNRPIRTVETNFTTRVYSEAHRPSGALIDAAAQQGGAGARAIAEAMTQLRNDARNTVLTRSGNTMLNLAPNSPFRGQNPTFQSYAALQSADNAWAAEFLKRKRPEIAREMARLFDQRYQDNGELRQQVIDYIKRKLIIKFVRGAAGDQMVTGSLSEYTDNVQLQPILSLVEDSLGTDAPAVRFVF